MIASFECMRDWKRVHAVRTLDGRIDAVGLEPGLLTQPTK